MLKIQNKNINASFVISFMLLLLLIICVKAAPKYLEKKSWPVLHQYEIWKTEIPNQTNNKINNKNDIEISDSDMRFSSLNTKNDIKPLNDRQNKVLNFFPHPVNEECLSKDGRRSGTCMNVYECRKKGGQGKGECALGFGVCCVFVVTCDQEISSNITYLVSPNFPSFMMTNNLTTCKIKINLINKDISQLRIDFNHMLLGQPNRKTGICDGDVLEVSGGPGGRFKICGQNSGQHVYYDVGGNLASRQSPSVVTPTTTTSTKTPVTSASTSTSIIPQNLDITNNTIIDNLMDSPVNSNHQESDEFQGYEIFINFAKSRIIQARFWEFRIMQIPFSQRAPAGCLQYFTGQEGFIQTFNFADNGRHLANQNYKSCIRQERNMCSIIYEPCDENSFRIGPSNQDNIMIMNVDGQNVIANDNTIMNGNVATTTSASVTQLNSLIQNDNLMASSQGIEQTTASNLSEPIEQIDDNLEGSGSDDGILPIEQTLISTIPPPVRGGFDILSFFRSTLFNFRNARKIKQEENLKQQQHREQQQHQHRQQERNGRQFFPKCTDRITMPCIVEDFIGNDGESLFPDCEPIHCGMSFCLPNGRPCRVESTVKPFYLGVHFGDGEGKGSPEENIGACLKYSQVACM